MDPRLLNTLSKCAICDVSINSFHEPMITACLHSICRSHVVNKHQHQSSSCKINNNVNDGSHNTTTMMKCVPLNGSKTITTTINGGNGSSQSTECSSISKVQSPYPTTTVNESSNNSNSLINETIMECNYCNDVIDESSLTLNVILIEHLSKYGHQLPLAPLPSIIITEDLKQSTCDDEVEIVGIKRKEDEFSKLIKRKNLNCDLKATCSSCQSEDYVVSFCPKCTGLLCSGCATRHHKLKPFRSHQLLGNNSNQAKAFDLLFNYNNHYNNFGHLNNEASNNFNGNAATYVNGNSSNGQSCGSILSTVLTTGSRPSTPNAVPVIKHAPRVANGLNHSNTSAFIAPSSCTATANSTTKSADGQRDADYIDPLEEQSNLRTSINYFVKVMNEKLQIEKDNLLIKQVECCNLQNDLRNKLKEIQLKEEMRVISIVRSYFKHKNDKINDHFGQIKVNCLNKIKESEIQLSKVNHIKDVMMSLPTSNITTTATTTTINGSNNNMNGANLSNGPLSNGVDGGIKVFEKEKAVNEIFNKTLHKIRKEFKKLSSPSPPSLLDSMGTPISIEKLLKPNELANTIHSVLIRHKANFINSVPSPNTEGPFTINKNLNERQSLSATTTSSSPDRVSHHPQQQILLKPETIAIHSKPAQFSLPSSQHKPSQVSTSSNPAPFVNNYRNVAPKEGASPKDVILAPKITNSTPLTTTNAFPTNSNYPWRVKETLNHTAMSSSDKRESGNNSISAMRMRAGIGSLNNALPNNEAAAATSTSKTTTALTRNEMNVSTTTVTKINDSCHASKEAEGRKAEQKEKEVEKKNKNSNGESIKHINNNNVATGKHHQQLNNNDNNNKNNDMTIDNYKQKSSNNNTCINGNKSSNVCNVSKSHLSLSPATPTSTSSSSPQVNDNKGKEGLFVSNPDNKSGINNKNEKVEDAKTKDANELPETSKAKGIKINLLNRSNSNVVSSSTSTPSVQRSVSLPPVSGQRTCPATVTTTSTTSSSPVSTDQQPRIDLQNGASNKIKNTSEEQETNGDATLLSSSSATSSSSGEPKRRKSIENIAEDLLQLKKKSDANDNGPKKNNDDNKVDASKSEEPTKIPSLSKETKPLKLNEEEKNPNKKPETEDESDDQIILYRKKKRKFKEQKTENSTKERLLKRMKLLEKSSTSGSSLNHNSGNNMNRLHKSKAECSPKDEASTEKALNHRINEIIKEQKIINSNDPRSSAVPLSPKQPKTSSSSPSSLSMMSINRRQQQLQLIPVKSNKMTEPEMKLKGSEVKKLKTENEPELKIFSSYETKLDNDCLSSLKRRGPGRPKKGEEKNPIVIDKNSKYHGFRVHGKPKAVRCLMNTVKERKPIEVRKLRSSKDELPSPPRTSSSSRSTTSNTLLLSPGVDNISSGYGSTASRSSIDRRCSNDLLNNYDDDFKLTVSGLEVRRVDKERKMGIKSSILRRKLVTHDDDDAFHLSDDTSIDESGKQEPSDQDQPCPVCGLEDPPVTSVLSIDTIAGAPVAWTACEICSHWYHDKCVPELRFKSKHFICADCKLINSIVN